MSTWRFVAGAVCPACSSLDSVRLRRGPDGSRERDCVECDFHDLEAPPAPASAAGKPAASSAPVMVEPETVGKLGDADLLDPDERPLRILDSRPPGSEP